MQATPVLSSPVERELGRRASALDTLPGDVVELIARFLLGQEVLDLARCGQRLKHLLSADAVWRWRLPSTWGASMSSSKTQYMAASSLLLRNHSGVPLPLGLFPKQRSISFDLWFSLSPPSSRGSSSPGGVLVGAQDINASVTHTPLRSELFAFVDDQRHLHCSVLLDKPVIARALAYRRWYHLALTYDHSEKRQCVFLDGALVSTSDGEAQFPWLHFAQLGVGFVAATHEWRAFKGLVDEFRVCYVPWTSDQVRRLANGKRTYAPMAYALKRDLCRCGFEGKSWAEVRCSRPLETLVGEAAQPPQEEEEVNVLGPPTAVPMTEKDSVGKMTRREEVEAKWEFLLRWIDVLSQVSPLRTARESRWLEVNVRGVQHDRTAATGLRQAIEIVGMALHIDPELWWFVGDGEGRKVAKLPDRLMFRFNAPCRSRRQQQRVIEFYLWMFVTVYLQINACGKPEEDDDDTDVEDDEEAGKCTAKRSSQLSNAHYEAALKRIRALGRPHVVETSEISVSFQLCVMATGNSTAEEQRRSHALKSAVDRTLRGCQERRFVVEHFDFTLDVSSGSHPRRAFLSLHRVRGLRIGSVDVPMGSYTEKDPS